MAAVLPSFFAFLYRILRVIFDDQKGRVKKYFISCAVSGTKIF